VPLEAAYNGVSRDMNIFPFQAGFCSCTELPGINK
jgi:hypothetical protein